MRVVHVLLIHVPDLSDVNGGVQKTNWLCNFKDKNNFCKVASIHRQRCETCLRRIQMTALLAMDIYGYANEFSLNGKSDQADCIGVFCSKTNKPQAAIYVYLWTDLNLHNRGFSRTVSSVY
ncbi:hypothetical protein HNY73_020772 [Argiope bruennichi]|uniref:Uncharacterized protein n=1 Tax=Argiope bruennichi TaxID=94029 RepID=A0A8T0E7U0_ARGBR|nr:hypothetical protein HNY73_020772 [Argiope bruennichi]